MTDLKQFTRADVQDLNKPDATIFVIHNNVYDVTPFLDEHPGGHEVLVGAGGTDASEEFDDIGHSVDAKELMKKYLIGEVVEEERVEEKKKGHHKWEDVKHAGTDGGWFASWRLPMLAAVAASLLWLYFT